jgi:hypothetical protein
MRIGEGGGLPVHLIADAERLQHAQQRSVAGQHAVVEFFKRPAVMLEERAETAELLRTLDQRDAMPLLRETQRTGEAGDAAAEYGD